MNPVKLISLSHSSNVICGTGNMRKSPKMQSFGIKIERIDRDLLCIYETAGQRAYMLAYMEPLASVLAYMKPLASVHICSK